MTGKTKALKTHKSFEGLTRFWEHDSRVTGTKMNFSTFTPPGGKPNGCLIWLSGLTCTDENFMAKAGAQKFLAEANLMVICPDTSPRGLQLPQEHESWDFGSGAGFYVDATTPGYRDHYRMYSYIVDEVYQLVESEFSVGKISISGHSMGGHGALTIGLREPAKFKSVSAFSPIVNPVEVPWGKKAFTGYFGSDQQKWKQHDACELLLAGKKHAEPILVDQGSEDSFLKEQLRTENFVRACERSGQKAHVHMRDGYDHSYYFVSTYIADHVRFHAERLNT